MATRKQHPRLKTYESKRDFAISPEPSGRAATKTGKSGRSHTKLSFCVQKHLASHLHYDFRLEYDGVLLSWSVPKGPSLDPKIRRMAIRTEDHPLDYGGFEGVIPSGYGAGVVLLWDKGTWTPEFVPDLPDVETMLDKGEIKFNLDGVKLKGSWVLVRTQKAAGSTRESWLLMKHKDFWSGNVDVLEVAPLSVKSDRDLSQILGESGETETMAEHPPAAGGDAGKLWREIIEAAQKPAPKPAKSKRRTTTKKRATGKSRTARAPVKKR